MTTWGVNRLPTHKVFLKLVKECNLLLTLVRGCLIMVPM